MMAVESEGPGITWLDWGVSEFKKWTVWTLNRKVNEWWFLLLLVNVIKPVCLILPTLECCCARSMSPGHVLCLSPAHRAGRARDSGSYQAVRVAIVGRTQVARVFSSLSFFSHFVDWCAAPELAGGLCCRAGCHCLLYLCPCAAAGQMELPNRLGHLGVRQEDGKWRGSCEPCFLEERGLKSRM